jgi:hypothetical protein
MMKVKQRRKRKIFCGRRYKEELEGNGLKER